jgi:hypothetical protein
MMKKANQKQRARNERSVKRSLKSTQRAKMLAMTVLALASAMIPRVPVGNYQFSGYRWPIDRKNSGFKQNRRIQLKHGFKAGGKK